MYAEGVGGETAFRMREVEREREREKTRKKKKGDEKFRKSS
jgi:hypothetical protein